MIMDCRMHLISIVSDIVSIGLMGSSKTIDYKMKILESMDFPFLPLNG